MVGIHVLDDSGLARGQRAALLVRPTPEVLEQQVRDLANYTVELKEIIQELFLAIAGRPKPPEGGQTA